MPQKAFDNSVARATGEDRRTIARHGFSPLTFGPMELEDDDFHEPQMVDWDQLERDRGIPLFAGR